MKLSWRKGFNFGLTSGIITTLGLMVGLESGTGSKAVVLGGILTIAIADSMSDALGMHISEESSKEKTTKQIWISTLSTFLAKLFFALTFVIPVLLFPLPQAIFISIIWGFLAIGFISWRLARNRQESTWSVVLEHWFVTALVIVLTHYVGHAISSLF